MVVPTGRRERLKEDYCWIDSMMNRFCMFYLAKSQQLQILAQKFKKLAKCCKKLFSTFFADFEWIILQKCIFCKRFKVFFTFVTGVFMKQMYTRLFRSLTLSISISIEMSQQFWKKQELNFYPWFHRNFLLLFSKYFLPCKGTFSTKIIKTYNY